MSEEVHAKIDKVLASGNTWKLVLADLDGYGKTKCIGNFPELIEGEDYVFIGTYQYHEKYKWGFNVEGCYEDFSTDRKDIVRMLSSGYIRGVGKRRAKKIAKTFGTETYEIIINDHQRLTEIRGIGDALATSIHEQFIAQNIYFEIYKLFQGRATPPQINKIVETYRDRAMDKIKENPYRLIWEVDGFGFISVDRLAKNIGIAEDADIRIIAAVAYMMKEREYQNGDCYSTLNQIKTRISRYKDFSGNRVINVPWQRVTEILSNDIKNNDNSIFVYRKVNEQPVLYLQSMNYHEKKCACRVSEFVGRPSIKNIDNQKIAQGILKTEQENGIVLDDAQRCAVQTSMTNRISIITGGPGTGKTTIIKALIKAWDDNQTVMLMAPTGKASRRMSELNNGIDASTIHKVLVAVRNGAAFYDDNYLIIVDESSMIDIRLADELMQFASDTKSQIVFVGDVNQLPPVGPGMFFKDLSEMEEIPISRLDTVHRNAGTIAENASRIKNGTDIAGLKIQNDFLVSNVETNKILNTVLDVYTLLVKKYGIENVCCLAPVRKETFQIQTGILNEAIRNKFNPDKGENTFQECDFRVGDRVMQTTNDYNKNVFNGDCGVVTEVNTEDNILVVQFDFGDEVAYSPIEAESSLVLAYAMTVHKSQGSEYMAVVFVECDEHELHTGFVKRNLVYTGVTRAKKQVVMVGSTKSMNKSIQDNTADKRNTDLKERIYHYLEMKA